MDVVDEEDAENQKEGTVAEVKVECLFKRFVPYYEVTQTHSHGALYLVMATGNGTPPQV